MRRVAVVFALVLASWIAFRLVEAHPLPDEWTIVLDGLSRWIGPLRPIELDAGELRFARHVLASLAFACAGLVLWLGARSFRLASRSAELGDRFAETLEAFETLSGSFYDLVERAYDVHFRHDLSGRMEWMNPGGLQMFGYSGPDLGALTIAKLLDAEQLAAARMSIEQAVESGRVAPRTDVLARRRDGRPLWLEINARFVRREGVPVAIEGVGRDVTARKLAEVQAAIQASISLALAETTSLESALRSVLQVLCRQLDWELGEAWWVDEQFDVIHTQAIRIEGVPEPTDAVLQARPRTFARGHGLPGRVWSLGETIAVEDLLVDPDPWCQRAADLGPFRRAVGVPIRVGQRVIGAVLLASTRQSRTHWAPLPVLDALGAQIGAVTDRRRAEEALKVSEARKQAVVETALDCVITADHEGRILEFNPAAESAFGYGRDTVLGRPLAELIVPPELRTRHLEGFRACLETGRRPLGDARIEVEGLRADGGRFPAELSIARIDVGRHPVFTAHVRDITERKEVDKLKDELVSTVSHELRTPLASIRGFVELMRLREYEPEERQEFLEILDKEIRRLGKLIDDFLDLQRLEARAHEYLFATLDLRELLEHAATVISATSEKHELEVVLPDEPLRMMADADRLEQCVLNLLSNAVKYSPEGGKVRLRVERVGYRVAIRVRDEGIGMAPETLEKLFTKFYRADSTATRDIGGTGLGLALVKEIAEAHGGEVSVESEPGRGSEFTLLLPLVEKEEKESGEGVDAAV
jgi:PAS domain S-box-containing protein